MTHRDVYKVVALLAIGYVIGWFHRRWHLKDRLRRRMRTLGMIPALALLWAGAEVYPLARAIAQQPGDSLMSTTLVRQAVGLWSATNPIHAYCVTWYAEREHLLVLLDATPADTTARPLCPDPRGGNYPLLIDAPVCPIDIEVTDRAWVVVRCGENDVARYRRRIPGERRSQ